MYLRRQRYKNISYIKPLYYLANTFFIAPLYDFDQNREIKSVLSKSSYFMLFLILITCIEYVYGVLVYFTSYDIKVLLMELLYYTIAVTLSLVPILNATSKRKIFVTMMKGLSELDKIIRANFIRNKRIQVNMNIIFIFLEFWYIFFTIVYVILNLESAYWRYIGFDIVLSMYVYQVHTLVYIITDLINHKVEHFNEMLMEELCFVRLNKPIYNEKKCMSVEEFRRIYLIISHIFYAYNDIFGFTIFLILLHILASMLAPVSYMLVHLDEDKVYFVLNTSFALFYLVSL